jgi:hypothetical protein
MSWRDKANEDCDFCHVLYRDDGAPLGCLLPLHGGEVGAADSGGVTPFSVLTPLGWWWAPSSLTGLASAC